MSEHKADRACAYHEAMLRFLAQKPLSFEYIGGRRPSREEPYDRGVRRQKTSNGDIPKEQATDRLFVPR